MCISRARDGRLVKATVVKALKDSCRRSLFPFFFSISLSFAEDTAARLVKSLEEVASSLALLLLIFFLFYTLRLWLYIWTRGDNCAASVAAGMHFYARLC